MSKDKDFDEFAQALRRLPVPISCFSDGACCPWCGAVKNTVTFGMNVCEECDRSYAFGYPDWHDQKDPISWVPFPSYEFDALGGKADLIPVFRPNKRLQEIYFRKSEEQLGMFADVTKPN